MTRLGLLKTPLAITTLLRFIQQYIPNEPTNVTNNVTPATKIVIQLRFSPPPNASSLRGTPNLEGSGEDLHLSGTHPALSYSHTCV